MPHEAPSYHLEGKTAIVTGAGQGIGRATANAFAASGAGVAVVDINERAARETVESITSSGHRAEAFVVDVTSSAAVAEQFAAIANALGPVEILVNNAGGGIKQTTIDLPLPLWKRLKIRAAEEGTAFRAIVIRAVEAELAVVKKGGKT